jgi:hypothetical protein
LYTDPAESIFSSTPELINPTRTDNIHNSGVNSRNEEEVVNAKVPFFRAQRGLSKKAKESSVTPAGLNSSANSKPVKRIQANSTHRGKRQARERDQKMTSYPIPAVQSHLKDAGSTPNDCASIFNFTQSPPPRRKGMTASERKKVRCLGVQEFKQTRQTMVDPKISKGEVAHM